MHSLKISFLSFFIYLSVNCFGQDLDKLSKYIENARDSFGIPGMAVGIVKDGEVVFLKGFGLRSTKEKSGVDENTVFAIASLSKAFTVASLSKLEAEGKLSWNDPVQKHLSYFRLHDPYVSSLITIEDLTCHRSGLATFDGDLLWYGTNYSREEIVRRIAHLPLKKNFRTDFGYQNIMYITNGEVIKKVSGKTWEEYLDEQFFTPLNMKNTVSSIDRFRNENVAKPHLDGGEIDLLHYDNSGATAALNSSVADMSRWIQLWLNNGVYNGDTLLSQEAIERALTPHTILSTGNFDDRNGTHFKSYGMGWVLMDYQGVKVAQHGGGLPGYISKIALVPEMNLGMIILTNDMTSLPTAMMYKIIDEFAGDSERDWASEFLEYKKRGEERKAKNEEEVAKSRVMNTKPSHALKDYVGVYNDKMYGDAEIELNNKELTIKLLPTAELFESKMKHWHYDTFEIKFKDPFLPRGFVTFEFDETGAVSGFKINLPNPDFHFYNLNFEKKIK